MRPLRGSIRSAAEYDTTKAAARGAARRLDVIRAHISCEGIPDVRRSPRPSPSACRNDSSDRKSATSSRSGEERRYARFEKPAQVSRTISSAIDSRKAHSWVCRRRADGRCAVGGGCAGGRSRRTASSSPSSSHAITQQAEFAALEQVRIPTLSGSTLPLSQLASLEFEKAPTLIQRFNRERAMTIDADAQPGFNVGELTQQVAAKLDQMNWPRGYKYDLGGENEASQEAFGGIGIAIIVAIFGIFAILVPSSELQMRSSCSPCAAGCVRRPVMRRFSATTSFRRVIASGPRGHRSQFICWWTHQAVGEQGGAG